MSDTPTPAVQEKKLPALVLKSHELGPVLLPKLEPDRADQARQLAAEIDVGHALSVTDYGVKAQEGLVSFTDSVLKDVRSGEAGPAGQLLRDLKGNIEQLDASTLPRRPIPAFVNFVDGIPLVGPPLAGMMNRVRAFIHRYEKLKGQIDGIVDNLRAEGERQKEHWTRLEVLHEKNQDYFDQLEVVIAAGELKLQELEGEFRRRVGGLPQDLSAVDAHALQGLTDFKNQIERLDRRVYNLKLARMSAVTSGPTIRVAQEGALSIVELVNESITFMIPEWQKNLMIGIALYDQRSALQLVEQARATTNKLMSQNAALLQETQAQIKSAQAEGFVKIDTLVDVTNRLIQTIDGGIQADLDNKKKRAEGLRKLEEAEGNLKQALRAAQEAKVADAR